MKPIETKNLILRKTSLDDVEVINQWENDEELIYYSEENDFEPQSLEDTKELINNIIQNKEILHLMILNKVSNEPLGYCMLASIDQNKKSAKIGITIGARQMWGRGFALEALQALVKYAFYEIGLIQIIAEVYSFNARAIALFLKLGFVEVMRKQGAVKKKNNTYDEVLLLFSAVSK